MKILPPVFAFLMSAGWLVPNHYPPWLSAWSDGVAITGLLLLAIAVACKSISGRRIALHLPLIAALCVVATLAQLATGKLMFAGDAVMVVLYIGLWLSAALTGVLMAEPTRSNETLDALMTGWLVAALLSVGIALVQWTGAVNLSIYAADIPSSARPFGNVAQPNHFCTLCFLGLCGLLWLSEKQKVGHSVFWLCAGLLLLGMVVSQSRTGWLQIGLFVIWGLAQHRRSNLRAARTRFLIMGAVYAAGTIVWPTVCDALLLSPGRLMSEQMQAGVRLPYWWAMIDAISREPLFGYGWQQVGAAQQRVALDHPPTGSLFDHSHNFALDLLLWNGLPIGGLIIVVLVVWFAVKIRACQDAQCVWLLAAVGGVFVHGLLEFPLSYAYFLLPVGLAMGAIESISPRKTPILNVSRWGVVSFSIVLGALVVAIAAEYFETEERYRTLRFELARISGATPIPATEPRQRILSQLENFLDFYQIEAKPDMVPDQIEQMRKVSERYGFSTILLRYALAAGLNGQPDVARVSLARICKIHSPQRCREARENWATLQERYPQLAAIPAPDQ